LVRISRNVFANIFSEVDTATLDARLEVLIEKSQRKKDNGA